MKNKTKEAADKARAEARAEEMERKVKAAEADKHNIILYNECLNQYDNSMQRSLHRIETYCNQSELQQLHDDAKNATLLRVCYDFLDISNQFIFVIISIDLL